MKHHAISQVAQLLPINNDDKIYKVRRRVAHPTGPRCLEADVKSFSTIDIESSLDYTV